ncbi:MAG: DUF4160 domain-containing protein [Alphaproteobacteria bacterium]|nr:DUF4160 domain-containing protein [Alphaproteobacteria bacterium]
MPEICRFFGIIIAVFYEDHPPPHFHVRYGSQQAIVSIETLQVLEGRVSPRVAGLVIEWANLHRVELARAWEQARRREPIDPIAPLE